MVHGKSIGIQSPFCMQQMLTHMDSNKADLKMLEEMGITPDRSVRERKPTLRTVGLAVIATVRMQKMQQAWMSNRKLHESLMKKLEGMKKKARKA